jgi:membrane protein required for colicin V production
MNWVDWLFVITLLLSAGNGLHEGFVRLGIGFAALIVGFFSASWFGGVAAGWLMPYIDSRPLAALAGFLLVFTGVVVAGAILAALLVRMLKIVGLSWFDRLLGGAFGLLRGFIVVVVVALVFTAFAPKSLPAAVDESRFAPYVFRGARVLAEMTPYELRASFNRTYENLRGLWKEATQHKQLRRRIEVRQE